MKESLNQRGILKGVQCVCGQWWPDVVRAEFANQFYTECCGALYLYTTGPKGEFTTLSLLRDARKSPEQEMAEAQGHRRL